MGNLALIFVCIGLGLAFRRFRSLPDGAAATLNRFVAYVSLPAVALEAIHSMPLRHDALYPILMPWIMMILSMAIFLPLGRAAGWSRQSTAALALTAGLGNTSFLGFPLLEAIYGPDAIPTAILVDQPGSFLVFSTIGVGLAASFSGGKPAPGRILRKIATFPPFLALLLALALRPVPYPPALTQLLGKLSATLIPLALVAVGLQLRLDPKRLRAEARKLAPGLAFKLAVAPALISLLYLRILGAPHTRAIDITILEAAMAPMVTAAILVTEYELDAELANLMLGVGIPLSLVTVPLWRWMLC